MLVLTVSSHLGYGGGESIPSPQHLVRAKHFSLAVEGWGIGLSFFFLPVFFSPWKCGLVKQI